MKCIHFFLISTFQHSTTLPSAMDTYDAEPEGLDRRTVHDVCEILPTFRVRCACAFPWNSTPKANCPVGGNGRTVKKVLCSDIKRLSEELTGVGKRSKKDVIKRYKSVTRERAEVGRYSIDCNSGNSFIL